MKIVVPIDNRPSSQAILDALVKMRWFEGSEIHLLTVLPEGTEYGTGDVSKPAVSEIEDLAVELHNALPLCEVSFVARHGDPRGAILEFAGEVKAELIVM